MTDSTTPPYWPMLALFGVALICLAAVIALDATPRWTRRLTTRLARSHTNTE